MVVVFAKRSIKCMPYPWYNRKNPIGRELKKVFDLGKYLAGAFLSLG
jgi:hypothetical protein